MKESALVLFVVVAAACDGEADPTPSPAADTGATADTGAAADSQPSNVAPDIADEPLVIPPPPAGGQQLLTDEYTLEPGTEKYFCYTFRSPDHEVGVVSVDNIAGDLVHHVVVYQALAPEPEGFHECNVLIRLTWMPVWASGRGGNGLTLPDQVAFKIPPNTQYVVQYHLLNPHPLEAVTERSAVNLAYTHDLTGYQPAGIFALGQFTLEIPKDARGFSQEMGCDVDQELNVFAAFPHMHLLGKKLELFHGKTEETLRPAYAIDPWPFGDQPFDPVDLHIARGDYIRARCTWDNTTGHDVFFGESTHEEMCFLVLFAYPMYELAGCGF